MASEAHPHPGASRLTPARARLCALLPRLTEREVELLLELAEYYRELRRGDDPAPPPVPTAPGPSAAPARPQSNLPLEDAPYTLSVPEAARLLGVSQALVRGLIREGRLAALRPGRRVLLSRTALERLLREEQRTPREGRQTDDA